jgi:hypothetical protein
LFKGWVSKLSVKEQIVNIFGFGNQTVSVAATQLCQESMKIATDNM